MPVVAEEVLGRDIQTVPAVQGAAEPGFQAGHQMRDQSTQEGAVAETSTYLLILAAQAALALSF
jgi:hypothetical protein